MNALFHHRSELMRIGSTILAFLILFGLMVLVIPPVHADDTATVTITDYKVSPAVLMPDSLGTITITVKNTATTSSIS